MMLGAGRWRYQAEVFPPVPHELIERGDHLAAARYVAECLVPSAVKHPEQAMNALVRAISGFHPPGDLLPDVAE